MDAQFTILIVESNDDAAALLKLALRRAGVHNPVQVVTDGRDAIDYLCAGGRFSDRKAYPFPKVIFTEMKLQFLNGLEILEWLRQHPECSVVPVIMLTAVDDDAQVKRAYQMGANAYLVKPAGLPELQEMVKTAFEFWRLCTVPAVPGHC